MRNLGLFCCSLATLFFINCTKRDFLLTDEKQPKGSSITIFVENEKGQSLLVPTTLGAFNQSEIRIFHIENQEEKLYYKRNLNNPWGFKIINYEERNVISLNITGNKNELPSTTIIQWAENNRDTLICDYSFDESSSHKLMMQVKLNGKEIDLKSDDYHLGNKNKLIGFFSFD